MRSPQARLKSLVLTKKKDMDIESIATKNYSEIIQVNVPTRFYFANGKFDGVEFGAFTEELMPWQEDMIKRCLEAIKSSLGHRV